MSTPLLSICIPTLNRGKFIGETLDGIVAQLSEQVELVIVDGGSADETAEVVAGYTRRCPNIRYLRRDIANPTPSNEGFDRDCSFAVEQASGTYCWLMTDDDLVVVGAVARVLATIAQGYDLIVGSVRVCTIDFRSTLIPCQPSFDSDRTYDRSKWSEFFAEAGWPLTFVGRVIIKRSLWLARRPERFFGTAFVHVGVIFSDPLDRVVVLAGPLVTIRYGNALWTGRAFDIWMYQWPTLVWSLTEVSQSAKEAITPRRPFRYLKKLVWYRALGAYTPKMYNDRLSDEDGIAYRLAAYLIARMPARLANAAASAYLTLESHENVSIMMYDLVKSTYASGVTRWFARQQDFSRFERTT